MFEEDLPDGCPPAASADQALQDVWRFLKKTPPTKECFHSFKKLGRQNKNGKPECSWASCSLFTPEATMRDLAKLPMFKRMVAAAQLHIPSGSGKSLVSSGGHVDFWMYSGFNPLECIQSVVKL